MPGIFGIIRKKRSSIDSRGLLDKMSEALMHMEWYTKELVSSDEYGFGSISIKNNFRPVHLEYGNKTYIVLVDGYIYKINGNQISNLIHPSETVARELLNLLAPMDPNCYVQVEGNYNIGVYNIEESHLTVISDIIGPRRLYYADFEDFFVFAPEVKAIAALPQFEKKLNWKGIADFLNYGYVLGDDTFFTIVKTLPSASYLSFDNMQNRNTVKKYWFSIYEAQKRPLSETVSRIYEALRESVREKLCSEASVICPISGGLDSRIILAILNDFPKDISIRPVTHGQIFSNEYKIAKQVCDILDIQDHRLVEITPSVLLSKYRDAVWFSEGMVPMTNAILLLYLGIDSQESYLFNGIYGGPTNYCALYYAQRHLDNTYTGDEKIYDIKNVISLEKTYKQILQVDVYKYIEEHSFSSIKHEFSKYEGVSKHFCDQRDAFFIENRMRRSICQGDLFRFIWEEQLPLSNYSLYNLYLTIPPEQKLNKKLLKQMLIRYFEPLAKIKDANTNLNLLQTPGILYDLKKDVIHRFKYYTSRISKGKLSFYDKSTYAHWGKWFQQDTDTYILWKDTLKAQPFLDLGIFNSRDIDDYLERVRKSGLGVHGLIRLTTLAMWSDMFLS